MRRRTDMYTSKVIKHYPRFSRTHDSHIILKQTTLLGSPQCITSEWGIEAKCWHCWCSEGGGAMFKGWHCWHQRKMGLRANIIVKYLNWTLFLNYELTRISEPYGPITNLAPVESLLASLTKMFASLLLPTINILITTLNSNIYWPPTPQCKNVCPP